MLRVDGVNDVPWSTPDRLFSCTVTAAAGDDLAYALLPDLRAADSGQIDYIRGTFSSSRVPSFQPWPMALTAAATYLNLISDESRLRSNYTRAGLGTGTLLVALCNDLRVPVFGSPPKDWSSLGQTLTSVVPGSGAMMAVASQGNGIVAIAVGIGVSVFIRVTFPAADAIGEGLEAKVRAWFGLGDSASPPDDDDESPLV